MHRSLASCLVLGLVLSCFAFPDDDRECKRHMNEGKCRNTDGHFTCGCLFHEKPKLAQSEWDSENQVRFFSQSCEALELPFHEDTCVVLPANPQNKDEYEFLCPNNGFFQTWGAYTPLEGSYNIRLWIRCCEATCSNWVCQWAPFTEYQKRFDVPASGKFVQGMRAKHKEEEKDTIWSLRVCRCDDTATKKEEL